MTEGTIKKNANSIPPRKIFKFSLLVDLTSTRQLKFLLATKIIDNNSAPPPEIL